MQPRSPHCRRNSTCSALNPLGGMSRAWFYSGGHASLSLMLRNFVPTAVLLSMVVVSFVGLFLGWISRPTIVHAVPLSSRRKIAARVGLIAVSIQAVLFIVLWTPLLRY